jgi:hypothetical protein
MWQAGGLHTIGQLPALLLLLARSYMFRLITLIELLYLAAGAMSALAAVCGRVTRLVQALQQSQLQQYLHKDSQQAKDQQQQHGQSKQGEQQQLLQHNNEGILLLATSLLNAAESLIILWPSPSLASSAFATYVSSRGGPGSNSAAPCTGFDCSS